MHTYIHGTSQVQRIGVTDTQTRPPRQDRWSFQLENITEAHTYTHTHITKRKKTLELQTESHSADDKGNFAFKENSQSSQQKCAPWNLPATEERTNTGTSSDGIPTTAGGKNTLPACSSSPLFSSFSLLLLLLLLLLRRRRYNNLWLFLSQYCGEEFFFPTEPLASRTTYNYAKHNNRNLSKYRHHNSAGNNAISLN